VDWSYIHLVSHPFAIVLSITGAAVGLAGWIIGRESLERYGLFSLLLAAVSTIPGYVSGIAAADDVSQRVFVQPGIVQTHRTWATWAALALVTCGIFAAFALLQPRDRRLRRFVLLLGAAAAALIGLSAYRGGKIVHGEEAESEGESARLQAPQDVILMGHVFGGVILAAVDRIAYVCATRHAGRPCVTASFDQVDFRSPHSDRRDRHGPGLGEHRGTCVHGSRGARISGVGTWRRATSHEPVLRHDGRHRRAWAARSGAAPGDLYRRGEPASAGR
jgi:uncharacterized membrane protein